jgi:biotin carboxyl carrier protein
MKIQAESDGEKRAVEIVRDGSRIIARIDDRTYELEASEPEPNVYLLTHEGRVYEVLLSSSHDPSKPVRARVGTNELDITIIDLKRLRGSASGSEMAHGRAEIRTAMPGKIVRILTESGSLVKKGDGVIVVEAMKMQNELKSPKDGSVSDIRVAEGDTVNSGDVLVVVD